MKPIHTNAVLDNVCTFLLHLSGLLLLYSIMVSSWGFSHSYAVKIFTAILHLIHLWSTQAILRWSIYVSLVDPELGALAFKATMVLRKVLLVILSCLVIQAYVRGLPFFVALAILVSYLVADMALIWMHRPAIADRRPPRHFLIYDPDTHGFFLGRDENVSGVELNLDQRVEESKRNGDLRVWLTNADMYDMVENGGLGRMNLVHRVGIPYTA